MTLLEQQEAAWKRWKAGERETAGRMFFKWYAPLLVKWAGRAKAISKNMEHEDYVQIGRVALIRALDDFEVGAGSRLPGWIEMRVKWACIESVTLQNGAMSIPNSKREKHIQMNFGKDTGKMLAQGYDWGAIRETLALKYRVHPLDIDALHAMRFGGQTISEEFDEDDTKSVRLVADIPPAEEARTHADAGDMITELFDEAGLKPREREILLERFSTDDNKEMALDKIAEKWGISRERVRRLVIESLERLGEVAKKRGLEFEDLW